MLAEKMSMFATTAMSPAMKIAMAAKESFDEAILDLEVTIDYNPDREELIQSIHDYIEAMRCSLLDVAFFRELKPT
ncbi:hypothetical protein KC19_VG088200 [Ceratodon purpureus]|uniref:Uncharacterized protein n=1 Tax=Ceratodon purpureus TaxID=3225 RepID=A0A8T0HNE2_CERPU|nr:hypothetical protein KC19_VG088200 [Ceratodon purpureus]